MTSSNTEARDAAFTQNEASDKTSDDRSTNISSLLQSLIEDTEGENVTLDQLFDTLDQRSYGPLLLLPAAIAVAPTGAIPGMSIVTGSIIALLAIQLLIGKSHPWIPSKLEEFTFGRDTLKKAVRAAIPCAEWIEQFLQRRFEVFVGPPADRIIALICMLLALSMYPLALLPFAVAAPGTAIIFFALALTTKDGLLALAGYIVSAFVAGLVYWMI